MTKIEIVNMEELDFEHVPQCERNDEFAAACDPRNPADLFVGYLHDCMCEHQKYSCLDCYAALRKMVELESTWLCQVCGKHYTRIIKIRAVPI